MTPTEKEMARQLEEAGWVALNPRIWTRPGGAMFRGIARAHAVMMEDSESRQRLQKRDQGQGKPETAEVVAAQRTN